MNGVLIVDKPAGMTSHDAVAICRSKLGVKKIGHAGTLDPDATGVLVLGVGRATRLLQFLVGDDKEYATQAVLGQETTTYDASGAVVSEADASGVDERSVVTVLEKLQGVTEQLPPMVSAIKVGGERLYKKARRGENIDREPRKVTIYELDLQSFEPGPRARVSLRVRCSKGTYIRSLVHDLGAELGTGAHISELRRTASGPFSIEKAVSLDDVSPAKVQPMEEAVSHYPFHTVDENDARSLVQGKPIPKTGIEGTYAIVGPAGLVAMAQDRDEMVKTLCVVAEQ